LYTIFDVFVCDIFLCHNPQDCDLILRICVLFYIFSSWVGRISRGNVARCRLASVKSLKLFDYFKHSAEK